MSLNGFFSDSSKNKKALSNFCDFLSEEDGAAFNLNLYERFREEIKEDPATFNAFTIDFMSKIYDDVQSAFPNSDVLADTLSSIAHRLDGIERTMGTIPGETAEKTVDLIQKSGLFMTKDEFQGYLKNGKESSNLLKIEEAKKKYLEFLARECGVITLEGLPADLEVGSKRLPLENIFIPLFFNEESIVDSNINIYKHIKENDNKNILYENTSSEYEEIKSETRKPFSSSFKPKKTYVPAGKVFSENKRLAILAAPGGGKTTFLKRLAIAYAFPDRRNAINDNLPEEDLFPVFIRCRQLGNLVNSSISDILKLAGKNLERQDLDKELLHIINSSLQNGNTLLLIDGIDEISSEKARISFVNKLHNFLTIYPNIRVVVTSREAGFRLISGSLSSYCQVYRISDLTDNDITRLTIAWNKEVIGDSPEVILDSEKLAENICTLDRVKRLAKNPLLLTTLLLVNRWLGQLPTKRSVLYGKAIEVLLMTWNVEGYESIDLDEAVPQLAFVAFSMMRDNVQRISIKRLKELLNQAREQMPDVLKYAKFSPAEFIERVELRSSLLILSGYEIEEGTLYSIYEFQHLTFQEYLAANAIVEGFYPNRKDNDSILQILQPYIRNNHWKEVIPLTGVLAGRKAQPIINYLLSECRADITENLGLISESSSDFLLPQVLLAQCILDDVKIAPNLLQESFKIISKTSCIGEICDEFIVSKFSEEWISVTWRTYAESDSNLMNLSVTLSYILANEYRINTTEEEPTYLSSVLSTLLPEVKRLLSSSEISNQYKGAIGTLLAASALKVLFVSENITINETNIIKDFEDIEKLLLGSPDIHLCFSACLSFEILKEIQEKFTSSPEIIQNLFIIWKNFSFDTITDVQILVWNAINKMPLINRDICNFQKLDIDSINFIKDQFFNKNLEYQKNLESEMCETYMKAACLIIGFYWKTPWNDEEILGLISESLYNIKGLKDEIVEFRALRQMLKSFGESGKLTLDVLNENTKQ